MPAPTTPEIALVAKLLATPAVQALLGTRITPQLATQEPLYPCATYARQGSEQPETLGGKSKLIKALVDVTIYAETEEVLHAAGVAVVTALTDPPWRDKTAGVQGCFHVDSNVDADLEVRNIRHTFAVWWKKP